jgi:iron complex outermembrane receptor protein
MLIGSRMLPGLSAALLAGVLVAAEAQPAVAHETHRFDVSPQDAAQAIQSFGRQSGIQIIADKQRLEGKRLNVVKGEHSVDEGLRLLLAGSGLSYQYVGGRTVALVDENESLRLARANASAATAGPETKDPVLLLDEVVVVGTHIRGIGPVGAEVITLERSDIDRTGLSTVQDVLETLPQTFGGGVGEDILNSNLVRESPTNINKGSAINLRGLGVGSTLILINGRRLAPGGQEGAFTDVSNIPLSAVERIEVMPDGASALYGSDAVGGVIHFRLRKEFQGAETQARIGSVTDGGAKKLQIAQTLGTSWGEGNGLLSVEYFKQDPLAATRRNRMVSDLRPYGGGNFDLTTSNPGTLIAGGQQYAIPANQDGRNLMPGDFAANTRNFRNRNDGLDLISDQERYSVLGTFEHRFTDQFKVFADALYTKRDVTILTPNTAQFSVPSQNAFYVNPTGGTAPVTIQYDLEDDFGPRIIEGNVKATMITLGGSFALPNDWQIVASFTRSEQHEERHELRPELSLEFADALADGNPNTTFNPFGDGSNTNPATLQFLRDRAHDQYREGINEMQLLSLRADGRLFTLPGGNVMLAIGAEYREDALDSTLNSTPTVTVRNDLDRDLTSGYIELFVPLVSESNSMPGVRRLEMTLAGRHEEYNDFGSAFVPRAGLTWSPVGSLSFRGTWSEAFRAPTLADVNPANQEILLTTIAPASGQGPRPAALVWGSKNPGLKEETAEIWTAGITFAPPSVPRLSIAATYFDIQFDNRVNSLSGYQNALRDQRFAPFIKENPDAEFRQNVCSQSVFLVGDPQLCLTAPVDYFIDVRLQNMAEIREQGVDFIGSYALDTGVGTFDLGLKATYLIEFSQRITKDSPLVNVVDTLNYPLNLRARGHVDWKRRGFGATLFVNYADDYKDKSGATVRPISSWTTFDLNLSYSFENSNVPGLSGTQIFLSGDNIFDKDPPVAINPIGTSYDPENADLIGRFISLHVRKEW